MTGIAAGIEPCVCANPARDWAGFQWGKLSLYSLAVFLWNSNEEGGLVLNPITTGQQITVSCLPATNKTGSSTEKLGAAASPHGVSNREKTQNVNPKTRIK